MSQGPGRDPDPENELESSGADADLLVPRVPQLPSVEWSLTTRSLWEQWVHRLCCHGRVSKSPEGLGLGLGGGSPLGVVRSVLGAGQ